MSYSIDPNNPLPRYYQVYQSLKDRIEVGEFHFDDALPPERQLVKDYNVSRITIVKALDTLENEGLIRREHGRGTFVNDLRSISDATATIAFVCGVMVHPYLYSVLMGIARIANERGYHLNVIGLHDESLDSAHTLRQIELQNIAGVLAYPRPSKKDLKLYRALGERNIPLVMIDRYYEEIEADYVVFDEEIASYEMTKNLIARGHKRIAMLTHYEIEASSIHNRIRGYRRALEEANLYRDDLMWLDVYADLHISKGQIGSRKNTERLRERLIADKVTALLAVNEDVAERINYDLMILNTESARDAINSDDVAGYAEFKVDIAAFGYRNLADFSAYNIITSLQIGEDLGTIATELLLDRLDGKLDNTLQHIAVPLQIFYPEDISSTPNQLQSNNPLGGE
ncbi:MAG: GntR family transcriptional regulator [Aggregatilineales bacterium]